MEEAAEILQVHKHSIPFCKRLIPLRHYKDSNKIQQYFSAEKHPTLWRALPTIKELQTTWEAKRDNDRFSVYQTAINNGLGKLAKYYLWFNKKPAYVIALSTSFFELQAS